MSWRTEKLLPNPPRAHWDIPPFWGFHSAHIKPALGLTHPHTKGCVEDGTWGSDLILNPADLSLPSCGLGISHCSCNRGVFFFLGHFRGCTAEQIYQVQHWQTIAGWCARAHRWLMNNLLKKPLHHIQDNAQNIMENVMLSAVPGSAHTWHHHYTATYIPCPSPNQRAISKFPSRLYIKHLLQKLYLIPPTPSKNTIISRIHNILSLKIAPIKAHCYQIKLPASLKWNKSSEHQFPPHNLLRPF